jgi:8-oxo-dGTP pyrophosphatase MutT (NUDIX family)
MSLEPEKFFIGLMDFFSILLPGALLTYLVMDETGSVVLGERYSKLASAEAWAAFLFASYLFGHLVFLLGSWLDEFYEWARSFTLNAQIARLARGRQLLPWPARALIWLVFKRERNLAVDRAKKIKEQALDRLQAKNAMNTFQWCKAFLNIESRASLAMVQRFEADSKFFRSFTVVLLLLLVVWPLQHKWPQAAMLVVLVLFLLALWRYMEQRLKATNQAYWSVITLTARGDKVTLKATPLADSPTHAGGVVFQERDGKVQYLLVEAKKDPGQWVLPKGHIEEAENPVETAIREVLEETGVWARVEPKLDDGKLSDKKLDDVSYPVNNDVIKVRFYLMQAIGRGLREDDRQPVWLSVKDAINKATHPETKKLLETAERKRVKTKATPALT